MIVIKETDVGLAGLERLYLLPKYDLAPYIRLSAAI